MKYHLCLAALLSTLLACDEPLTLPPEGKATGRITVLDTIGPEGNTGWWPNIAFDSKQIPHVSYCDAYHGNMMYAVREADGSWRVEVVNDDGAVGKYASMAIGPDDQPAVAYYDQSMKYLRYSYRTTEGWKHEKVAWGLEVGMGSSLGFDAKGRAHLVYYLPSGKFAYGRREGPNNWTKKILIEVTGGFSVKTSMVQKDDAFWVSFVDWNFTDTTLHLARPLDAEKMQYHTEIITDRHGPGWRSQIIFQGNTPTIVYSSNRRKQLKLTEWSVEGWKHTVLVNEALTFAARADSKGDYVIAYEDMSGKYTDAGSIKLLRGRDKTWEVVHIDHEGPSGEHLAMAINSQGQATIAYFSRTVRGIKIYDESAPN